MRQYERMDCLEVAREGESLRIGTALLTANGGGDVDEVAIFGNPKTRDVAWVPYGSTIDINGMAYTVIRGELKTSEGNRFPHETKDQSTACLVDEKGRLHDLTDFLHADAKVQKMETSRTNAVDTFNFDRSTGRLEYFVKDRHQKCDDLLKKYILT